MDNDMLNLDFMDEYVDNIIEGIEDIKLRVTTFI
mgnify:CR=1 FL=1